MSQPWIRIEETATEKAVVCFCNSASPEEFCRAMQQVRGRLTGSKIAKIAVVGPDWATAMLVHEAHATPAVAVLDDTFGWVVVESHDPRYAVGQVLPKDEG